MRIRHADPARDGSRCAEIYAPSVLERATSFEERAPTGTEMGERIARVQTLRPWLVAELDGVVAAYAYAAAHRDRSAYRWATEVSVYVDDAHRRRGLGRALYRPLLDSLADQGYTVALAGITLPNPGSVGLHEALGFVPVGVYREIGWKFGRAWDVGWWQRPLHVLAPGEGAPPDPTPPPAERPAEP